MSNLIVSKVGCTQPNISLVKVDRSSVLGNPFYMKSEAMRDDVCDKYEAYFRKEVEDKNSKLLPELRRIYKLAKVGKVQLVCHCAPRRCHADTIKSFLDSHLT
jgi:hypothetical protein